MKFDIGVTSAEASSIASVLAGKFKVNIKEGRQWLYNFNTETIEYRQEDLNYLREDEVIANLLHDRLHVKG